jgi:nucleotide-binding universal stress UspA family protein
VSSTRGDRAQLVTASYQAAIDARGALDEQLTEAMAALGDGGDASSRVIDGDAALEPAEASAELYLLALGSRGYGFVRSVLLGSVSRALVRIAACPVVVLPQGAHGVGENPRRRSATSVGLTAAMGKKTATRGR